MDGSNLLAAIFCTTVALFVGVILARVFPEGVGMDMGNAAEWVAALAAVVTAAIAGKALWSWQDQMRGTSRHAAAAEIAEAAQLTKYHFYDARNPWFGIGEFSPAYRSLKPPISSTDEAKGWAFVFQNRYELLNTQILSLATLRAKAGALLGEETANALGDLAKKARELHNFFEDRIEQLRVGQHIVSQWSDQNWVKRVNASYKVDLDDHTDPYSLEFEAKFESLMQSVRAFL